MRSIKAVFLDRDGTINEDRGYVHRAEDLVFLPGVIDAMISLTEEGIKVYIVTNQAGIARGYFTEQDFKTFTAGLLGDLASRGIRVEDVLYCPHHPEGTEAQYSIECDCRKPRTALIERAMEREGLDPRECVLIGDKNSDVEAGRRLGMETYLVLTGCGIDQQDETRATYVMRDLFSAVAHITKSVTGRADERELTDAIILAGGLGTRLGDVAGCIPKALAPVHGRPFLDLLLTRLDHWGRIGRVVIATGYRGDQIADTYGQASYRFELVFSRERELLGTGGAIKKALKHTSTKKVMALNGDSYVEFDPDGLQHEHVLKAADMTMVLTDVDDVGRFGSVALDKGMRIVGFEEKRKAAAVQPVSGFINAGVYLFERQLFDDVEDGVKVSLETELLPGFIEKNIFGYVSSGRFIDIGTPQSYGIADAYLEGVQNA